MDPLAPLRKLPERVRAYYYRLAASVGALAVILTAVVGGDAAVAGQVVAGVMGVVAALLATANTSR